MTKKRCLAPPLQTSVPHQRGDVSPSTDLRLKPVANIQYKPTSVQSKNLSELDLCGVGYTTILNIPFGLPGHENGCCRYVDGDARSAFSKGKSEIAEVGDQSDW
ncbi:hypothetical protein AVEN_220025-1 [Araneus ventricosus]|uniref:Uncharacterized protein n=1 Tax=Araneus ventricosus TaxID=182803 RepID=A0A4Y2CQ92_ARAVE|nr:hypothetical protein AVEN_220025-1 [Araneus ventricosus]